MIMAWNHSFFFFEFLQSDFPDLDKIPDAIRIAAAKSTVGNYDFLCIAHFDLQYFDA